LVSDTTRAKDPWLALTGDTLFVGDIGRPDLVGQEAARELAGAMHDSLFEKLLPLQDGLLVFPGHGSGSLCGKSIGSMRSTTLGYERRNNPALQPRSREDFIGFATSNLPEQPGNHQRIKQINRSGPVVLGEITPKPLSIREAIPHFQRGAAMLDTRSKESYVTLHVPGAVHLESGDQLSSQVGFVLAPDYPLVLVLENVADYREIVYNLARVGFDKVVGYLSEGLDTWQAMGLPVTSGDIQDITSQDLYSLMVSGNGSKPVILDVREPWEYQQGHLPGAVLIPLGQLAGRVKELDSEKAVAVVCQSGNRSQSGAAVLGQNQFKTIYNLLGGTSDWARQGLPLER
jgi:hydroxyacylglutathione hydrolase